MPNRIKYIRTDDMQKTPIGADTEVDATLSVAGAAADSKAAGDAIAAGVSRAKTEAIGEIVESVPSGSANFLDIVPIARLGYYYSDSDQSKVNGDTVGSLFRYTSDDLVPLGDDVPCFVNVFLASDATAGFSMKFQCWGESYISATPAASVSPGVPNGILIPEGTTRIRILATAPGDYDFSKLYVSFDAYEETEESAEQYQVKQVYLSAPSKTLKTEIMNELTESVSEYNILDPSNLKAWGINYQIYDGAQTTHRAGNVRVTKNPILTENASTLYVRRNAMPTAQLPAMYVFGYSNDGTYVGSVNMALNGEWDEYELSLPTGSYRIHIRLNMYEYEFKAEDLCLSLEPLSAFEPYESVERFIKPTLIKDRSALYKKNVVFLGDSIFAADESPTSVPYYVGEYTGCNAINCCIGGTSAEIRNAEGSVYSKWCTLAVLAEAIHTGEWTTILQKAEEQLTGNPLARIRKLSQMDWTKVDTIVIAHGYNGDYGGAEPEDPMDTSIYPGAMRYAINAIQTAYPTIRMFCCTMIPFGSFYSRTEEDQAKILYGNTRLKSICDEFGIGYIYNWNIFGKNTYQVYLYNPYVHPTEEGKKQIARHVAHELW